MAQHEGMKPKLFKQDIKAMEDEFKRTRSYAIEEWKRLNDRLTSEGGRKATRIEGVIEAGMSVSRFTEQVNSLTAMLQATDQLHETLRDS